jgi:hypothetical protein
LSYRPATFQFPVAKGFFNPEQTRKASGAGAGQFARPDSTLHRFNSCWRCGNEFRRQRYGFDFFVCRARIGLTWHDTVFVKRSLRRIMVWSTIVIVITGNDLAKAGPFRDFFTTLRGAFAQPNEKPRRHRTSHKHNETPPSDSSNKQSPGIPAPAPPDQRNVRMAKAASGANQQKANLPYGVPVPGKEWLVTSPFAPDSGYIDVTGFRPGTQVEDPYTAKVFLTP